MREIVETPRGQRRPFATNSRASSTRSRTSWRKLEKRIERQALLDEADRRMAGRAAHRGAATIASMRSAAASACSAPSPPRSSRGRWTPGARSRSARNWPSASGRSPQRHVRAAERLGRAARRRDHGRPPASWSGVDHLGQRVHRGAAARDVVGQLGARDADRPARRHRDPEAWTSLTPPAEWVAENAALDRRRPQLHQLTGEPHHVGLLTEWSRRVMLQADPAIEQLVRADFTQKLAAAVDLAALKGSGAGAEPLGIAERRRADGDRPRRLRRTWSTWSPRSRARTCRWLSSAGRATPGSRRS